MKHLTVDAINVKVGGYALLEHSLRFLIVSATYASDFLELPESQILKLRPSFRNRNSNFVGVGQSWRSLSLVNAKIP